MTATVSLDHAFHARLRTHALAPLWEHLRAVMPNGRPAARTVAHCWHYAAIRPLLLEAGREVPVERAERRVLVLSDPGRGPDALQATGTVYAGLQLLLPGETAPTHRHTPSAARVVIEGSGGYTVVDGRHCEMLHGDLILTPSGEWHDHGHGGHAPVIWLDVLDLPVLSAAEAACATPGGSEANRENALAVLASQLRTVGLAPPPAFANRRAYPQIHFPWRTTRSALIDLLGAGGPAAAEVHYINPETGESCLPMLGFTATMLVRGACRRPPLRSSGALYHVIEGTGRTRVDDDVFDWGPGDTFSAPSFARIEHEVASNAELAFVLRVDDEPLQRKLGFFAEREAG